MSESGQPAPREYGQRERFIRFIAVGVLNTLFGYGVFAAIYLLTGSHRIAIVVATVAGVMFNYFTTGRLVFRNTGFGRLIPFVIVYSVVIVANILLVDLFDAMGLSPFIGQALSLPVMVGLAFILNDRFVFRRPG